MIIAEFKSIRTRRSLKHGNSANHITQGCQTRRWRWKFCGLILVAIIRSTKKFCMTRKRWGLRYVRGNGTLLPSNSKKVSLSLHLRGGNVTVRAQNWLPSSGKPEMMYCGCGKLFWSHPRAMWSRRRQHTTHSPKHQALAASSMSVGMGKELFLEDLEATAGCSCWSSSKRCNFASLITQGCQTRRWRWKFYG